MLAGAIARDAPWAADRCAALGALAGDEQVQELARLANRHLPELKTHDRFGNRIDWVDFHPSWHELMSLAWQHEVPNLAWRTAEQQRHFARAVLSYLWNQVEQGTACPTGMAYAAYAGFARRAGAGDLGREGRRAPPTSSAGARSATSHRSSSATR